jgi:hypothetical protein
VAPITVGLPMKRLAAYTSALLLAVLMPSTALASTHGTVTGRITYLSSSVVTIQTGGREMGVVNAMTRTANALSGRVYPYVYGGGHAEAGVASIGIRGPGYNGRRKGYDCSGSVAAVLAGGGLWAPGSGVPNDYGIVVQLLHEHLIARGVGKAPNAVNLYDDPNYHIFMSIDGRFFGTSDGGGGNAKGGPTWLYDGAPDTYSHAYHAYHVLPSVLRNRTSYGHSYTFNTYRDPALMAGAELGDKVRLAYSEARNGAMTATAISWVGAISVTGTVTSLAPDGSSLTIQTPGNQTLTFATSQVPQLIQGVQVGDGVQISYTRSTSGQLIPHALTVTSQPAAQPPAGPTGPGYGGPDTAARPPVVTPAQAN